MTRCYLKLPFGFLVAFAVTIIAITCQSNTSTEGSEDMIVTTIQRAIESAGLSVLDKAEASFVFRKRTYSYQRDNGKFEYTRSFADTSGNQIVDHLSNEGHIRYMNGEKINVEEKKAKAYSRSVNSVIYFAFLPYNLKDPAVNAEYLGKVTVRGKNYHKVKVTFGQEAGGKDWEDTFYYWFDADNHKMDYLAYEYTEDDGEVDLRFREAYNPREVAGVRIQDYYNFKPKKGETVSIHEVAQAYEQDRLELLSKIELTDVQIRSLDITG
ncbi:MAG: hypothetical protein OEQ53_22560 [Saprospiraceae bacterium]|nr:hypothetical protein [Saprospiraceae bacterium]